MALDGKVVLLTGASMGIGEAIAQALASQGANLALVSRTESTLKELSTRIESQHSGCIVKYYALDVGDYESVDKGVAQAVKDLGQIDILINNAGLALGTPARFPDLKISDIVTMNNTNVNGYMFMTHAVLNHSMMPRGGQGTILNVTSVTALEAPPFPGETVYHANKALQEAFTNGLRNELSETNIRILALRPGVVDTHFHTQRVGFDKDMHEGFMKGFQPLAAKDIADAAVFMLSQPLNYSVKALDVVPTVSPFYIETRDGVRLYTWHVLPLGVYHKHYKQLSQLQAPAHIAEDFTQTLNFQLLKSDPESRLVVHTHGSSGALTAYARADTYRFLSALSPGKIHVLAFDYRGFGSSTGSPTEDGLREDVLSVYNWATEVAMIPPERIVVFGQSMGAGPAISLVRELSIHNIAVAGLIITGATTSVPECLTEVRVFGMRVLPIARFPALVSWLTASMQNRWPNEQRLADIIHWAPRYHIEIFHAEDDLIVPWYLSHKFFECAVSASYDDEKTSHISIEQETIRRTEMGEGGWTVEWPAEKGRIRQEVTTYGVHDQIMAHPQIAMAIYRAFMSTGHQFMP
ncbi:hypothetical protein E8E14_013605 [Neopestalotiopsis sp. 37M]|nr:hypothetical protein E8E14_013605 [Neopestalotiopsis sp. 37M]